MQFMMYLRRLVMKWFVLAFSVVFVSCGSDTGGANHVDVCTTNPIMGCGQTCTIDADCVTGLFCGTDGKCMSECIYGGAGCATDQYCGPNGRCAPSPGGGDGGSVPGGCTNLQCQQVACTPGSTTTLTGKVYTPAGNLPLYNALVYVPNGPLSAFTPGVSCDACRANTSGSPIASAITGPDGTFSLDNVPVGNNIPLVIQVGRWRRQVTVAKVAPCVSAPITDVNMLRLPKNKSEGDIPLMAISTGQADPFECLLRKIGIDDAEFTVPTGTGRVHYYVENGIDMSPAAPAGSTLWSDVNNLKKYDVVMLPCEGGDHVKPATATQNIIDYTDAGGRMFATHYSYVWIYGSKNGTLVQNPFPTTGMWDVDQNHPMDPFPFTGTINTSFPKGMAFSQWLGNVGATPTAGKLDIVEARHDIDKVNDPPSKSWIDGTFGTGTTPNASMHLTFNTPINPTQKAPDGSPLQCGRVVYSDFHVSATALSGMNTFPASCKNNQPLTPQEKALVFMLFDLSACVQNDNTAPTPPIL
jgi:hypothetical protein